MSRAGMDADRSTFIKDELPRIFPPPAGRAGGELLFYGERLSRGGRLSAEDAGRAVEIMIGGGAHPYETALFLSALRVEKCGAEEIAAMAGAMREKATPVDLGAGAASAVDIVGTGGDDLHLFNISTASMFILAAAGPPVAKHGNRASTSRCGSADVLEELGVRIDLSPEGVARCVERAGTGFMFAPRYHPAMKNVAAVRRALPFRTVFNVLGPLCNPARVPALLLGVYHPAMLTPMARALSLLGVKRAVVVCGSAGVDGRWMDEVSTGGPTRAIDVRGDTLREFEIDPAAIGLSRCRLDDLRGGAPRENARALRGVLDGTEAGPKRDICLANAAAAIYGTGNAEDLREGMARAREALDGGGARRKLSLLIKESHL